MPGRKYEAQSGYRYGFNEKEKDKDLNSLTAYDYGFRIYNPGIGKFLSVDPLTKEYPWNSTYAFAENDPINYIDLDGLEKAKKQRLTFPKYMRVKSSEVYALVISKSSHTEYRKLSIGKNYWTIGAREYGFMATYEDLTLEMYDADGDPDGNATIGFGHLIHYGMIGSGSAKDLKSEEPFKNGINISVATDLYIEDVHEKEEYVNRYLTEAGMSDKITGRQFTALVDIAYNMGQGRAQSIIKILKEKGATAAAEQIRKWKPKKINGLTLRREFEALLIENKDFVEQEDLRKELNNQKKKENSSSKKEKKKQGK